MDLNIKTLYLNETEVELMINACDHMIKLYDTNTRQLYIQKAMIAGSSEESQAVFQHQIETTVNLVGYYQRIKERLTAKNAADSNSV